MTPQPLSTKTFVIDMTSSASLALSGFHSGVSGMKITPVYVVMNENFPRNSQVARGISAAERSVRIRNNPLRADAIVKGRQRIARIAERLNPGFRPLSVLRLAAGLSQAELAAKMGMQQPNIARLEKKPGDPSLSTLQKLAEILGVDVREVIVAVEVTNQAGASRAV